MHTQRHLFFFNYTAPPEIYTLSLHDALPISRLPRPGHRTVRGTAAQQHDHDCGVAGRQSHPDRERRLQRLGLPRSEEHPSELQSQSNLVCRLLLANKKTTITVDTIHSHMYTS